MEHLVYKKVNVICTVGLPASGKTLLCNKIGLFLNSKDISFRIFNFSVYKKVFFDSPLTDYKQTDPEAHSNTVFQVITKLLSDAVSFAQTEGTKTIVIDCFNHTKAIRQKIYDTFSDYFKGDFSLLWIEMPSSNTYQIDEIIKGGKKYDRRLQNKTKEELTEMLKVKIAFFNKEYEPICIESEAKMSYIKIKEFSRRIEINNLRGALQTKLVSSISNFSLEEPTFYMTRVSTKHEENDKLAESKNKEYGCLIKSYLENVRKGKEIRYSIVCSTSKESLDIAKQLEDVGETHSNQVLNSIKKGVFEGVSLSLMKRDSYEDYKERHNNKSEYRYPKGESYFDLMKRIDPIVQEIECNSDQLIIVSHLPTLRCLYGYFACFDNKKIPYVDVPVNCLIKFKLMPYGFRETRIWIDPVTGQMNKEKTVRKMDKRIFSVPSKFN